MPVAELSGSDGIAFLVAYGLVAEIIAKACSSPQTAELNAGVRAGTLMKWVNIGTVEACAGVAVAAYLDPKHRRAILMGGIIAGVVTYGEYIYAKRSGLANGGPATESW